MRPGWAALVLSGLLLAAAPAARGEEPPPDWTIDTFRWSGTLSPATSLVVRNPFGDVRLRAADAGEVELSAMIQRRTADPVKPEVRVERRRGRLAVEVVYPVAPQGDLHRVDLALFVPAGARISVETRDGLIEGRGLENDVRLESGGGDVVFSTTGSARVSSVRGNITADLRRDLWGRRPRLRTRLGNITLRLPSDADARVRIRASGEVAVQRPGRFERRTARRSVFTLGNGSHSLTLETLRGQVTLLAP